jgi:hypothetical protein
VLANPYLVDPSTVERAVDLGIRAGNVLHQPLPMRLTVDAELLQVGYEVPPKGTQEKAHLTITLNTLRCQC